MRHAGWRGGEKPAEPGSLPRHVSRCAARGIVAMLLGAGLVAFASTALTGLTGSAAAAAPFAGAGLFAYGDAPSLGSPVGMALVSPPVAIAPTPNGRGYWIAAADGGVFSYGAGFYGSAGGLPLQGPLVGMASDNAGDGYWLAALDGGVFAYGGAQFHGSMGGHPLNQPIVGMAADPATGGYWLVAADGGIFSFGAPFYGSMGGHPLNAPVVGMAAVPGGGGYWLVAADGGIFSFGDAGFYGSTGSMDINASIVGMAATSHGQGYWLAGSDGGVYTFGDAGFHGSDGGAVPTPPVDAIASTADGGGYWLLDPDGYSYSFANPGADYDSFAGLGIVEAAASQVGADPVGGQGLYCNPYGPCEEWCALFATWAWEQGGVGIPSYAFVGDIYDWAAQNGQVIGPNGPALPGDTVLYGTGPANTGTAVHVGVVTETWPDGAIITVDGDAGPGPYGHHDVDINGPFLPWDSGNYNGFPIFAFARP